MIEYTQFLGRPFVHGTTDCYGLIRDFYSHNFKIELTDYARPDEWWTKGMNLYMDHFYDEGFRLVDEPVYKARVGDILLVPLRSPVPNHAGIFVGDGKVIHHAFGRLSEETQLRGIFRDTLCAMVRHKDLVIDNGPEQTIDLMDLILPHKRIELENKLRDAQSPAPSSDPSPQSG